MKTKNSCKPVNPDSRMPKIGHLKLSNDAKNVCDQLHNDSKNLILSSNGHKPQRPKCKNSFKTGKSPSDKFTVIQLHELL